MSDELITITPGRVRAPRTPKPVELTPNAMISAALQKGDLEMLNKIMDFQQRIEDKESRRAYVQDMADFKAEGIRIIKDQSASFGQGKASYKFANLQQVSGKIGEALSRHGFSHRWDIKQENGMVSVSCILTHILGHSESTTMFAPPDSSGNKAAIQQIASTVSYLQRYTILAITGLATGEDDDGGGRTPVSKDTMDEETFHKHLTAIGAAPSVELLQSLYLAAIAEAKTDQQTKDALCAAKNTRYRAITASKGSAA